MVVKELIENNILRIYLTFQSEILVKQDNHNVSQSSQANNSWSRVNITLWQGGWQLF